MLINNLNLDQIETIKLKLEELGSFRLQRSIVGEVTDMLKDAFWSEHWNIINHTIKHAIWNKIWDRVWHHIKFNIENKLHENQ